MPIRTLINGAEGLTGSCKACGGCERQFLAIQVQTAAIDALKVEDVAEAAEQLAWARSLSDLFPPGDLDLPDAA